MGDATHSAAPRVRTRDVPLVGAFVVGRSVGRAAADTVAAPGAAVRAETPAIRQLLALPESVAPAQVVSLMTLGGPSFALPDHSNHIHVGFA